MPWRNELYELRQEKQSYEGKYKEVEDDIQKHEPYLDIDYKVLQNFNIIESDDEEDVAEFSVINPDLLDLVG